MQTDVQSELLLAFTSHGLAAEQLDHGIFVHEGQLTIQSAVTNFPSANGNEMVVVDIRTHSPRLGEKPIVESFAGFGTTQKNAIGMAFGKFLLGNFHTLIEALSDHSCTEAQAERLHWQGTEDSWQVFCGPIVRQSEPEGDAISEQCGEFFLALESLFLQTANTGDHWLRVFVAVFNGQLQTAEVLLDNVPWPDGEALARSWPWVMPQSYASTRVFAIAMADSNVLT